MKKYFWEIDLEIKFITHEWIRLLHLLCTPMFKQVNRNCCKTIELFSVCNWIGLYLDKLNILNHFEIGTMVKLVKEAQWIKGGKQL